MIDKVEEVTKKTKAKVKNDDKMLKEIKQKEEQNKAKKKLEANKVSDKFKHLRGKIVDLIF